MGNIRKNFSYQMVYRILSILTPLITSPIISRAFGPDGMGLYSATIAYVTYFTLFAMLGVEKYGNRTIASYQDDLHKRSELFFSIYAVQITSSLLAITAYLISFLLMSHDRWNLALIQGIWILSYLFDINWFFFGIEQFKLTVIRSSIIKVITVLLIALLIRKPDDLYLYAFIMGFGQLIGQLVLWRFVKQYVVFIKPTLNSIKIHVLPIIKLYVPIIAITIFRLMDKSMLDYLSTEENVGYYYSADKVVNIPLSLVTAVSTVMLPRVSNIIHNNSLESAKHLLSKAIELTILLVSAVSFGIAAIAEEFVPFFFGAGFEPCVLLIYWFVPVLVVKTLEDIICNQYLIPARKDNIYIIALFAGAASNIIANYILIQHFDALGAVLGTLIAESIVLFVALLLSKEVPFMLYFIKQTHYLVFGFIMFIIVRLVSSQLILPNAIKTFVLICIGGIIYCSLCLIWSSLKKDSLLHSYLTIKNEAHRNHFNMH